MDEFDFEDSLGSLGDFDPAPVTKPAPKKKPGLRDMFSEDSENDKPKTHIGRSTF